MKPEQTYQDLKELAEKLGVTVSEQNLRITGIKVKSGLCKVKGKNILIIDKQISFQDKNEILASCLSKLPHENIFNTLVSQGDRSLPIKTLCKSLHNIPYRTLINLFVSVHRFRVQRSGLPWDFCKTPLFAQSRRQVQILTRHCLTFIAKLGFRFVEVLGWMGLSTVIFFFFLSRYLWCVTIDVLP